MDQLIIEQKIESLRRCLQRIAEKTPSDADALLRDTDLQDIPVLKFPWAINHESRVRRGTLASG